MGGPNRHEAGMGRGAVTRAVLLAGRMNVAEVPDCVESPSSPVGCTWIPTSGPCAAVNRSFPRLFVAKQVRP